MKPTDEVLDVLKQVKPQYVADGWITTMPQVDRNLYIAVNKVIECLGGKWNRKAKAHVWTEDPNEPLAIVVATGEVTDWKKDFQFFETPGDVVDRMIHRAGLNSEMSILEPSAGLGAILSGIMYQAGLRRTMAVEINPKMARDLNNRFWRTGMITRERDFLTCGSELGRFDRILMNPPFSRGQDIAHVAHAWEMLKSGGRLVAITSPGWEFRTDSKHCRFRDWLTCLPKTIIENLPEGTFKSSGTNVRAKLITLNKPEGQQ